MTLCCFHLKFRTVRHKHFKTVRIVRLILTLSQKLISVFVRLILTEDLKTLNFSLLIIFVIFVGDNDWLPQKRCT